MSLELDNILYFPTLRTGQNEINALLEIEAERRRKISPILLIRKNIDFTIKLLDNWNEGPVFVGISTYGQDSQDEMIKGFNNRKEWLNTRKDLFNTLKKYKQLIPIVNFSNFQNSRELILLTRHLLNEFEYIALKIDLGLTRYDENLNKIDTLLTSLTDEEVQKTILIIDSFNTNSPNHASSYIFDVAMKNSNELINKFERLITISSSWPKDRPERGQTHLAQCTDPMFQALIHFPIKDELQIACYYGDYASTSPSDLMDDFDPTKMSPPIPFAGYLLNNECSWILIREGMGGQNEKFRDIAKSFINNEGFHEKDFCWATKIIHDIADGTREKAGSISFWNKIRVNQHICGMLKKIENGLIDQYIHHFKSKNESPEE